MDKIWNLVGPYELILNHYIKSESPPKQINPFHFVTNQEIEHINFFRAKPLFLISKSFNQTIEKYLLKNHVPIKLSSENLFIYTINTNMAVPKFFNTIYLSLLDENSQVCYNAQRNIETLIFQALQWFYFRTIMIDKLNKWPPRMSYLKTASINAISYAGYIRHYVLLNNIHSHLLDITSPISFNPKLLDIYSTLKKHIKDPELEWIGEFITSNASITLNSVIFFLPTFIPYRTAEFRFLTGFLKNFEEFCLKNKDDILYFLNDKERLKKQFLHCNEKTLKCYFIMRFLIVFQSTPALKFHENYNEEDKKQFIYKFLQELSTHYWYNKFEFTTSYNS